ncbi:cytochrome b/b6 domain-containing protein, partial [Acinetobacter baumannii]
MAQNTATSSTDLLIRFLHIVIILSFTGAYLTGDAEEWHQVHMAFGYTL